MSRITTRFKELKETGRTALIPFVTAGDPQTWVTVPLMHRLVESGADILELGVPFSDPMAEGPVIQKACERALLNHVSLRDVLTMVAEFRQMDKKTPVILMGYLNPVEVMGYEQFAREASDAGVDGVLTVDLPPEEGTSLIEALKSRDMDAIFLLSPTSNKGRIAKVTAVARGFIYYVSLRGVTGAAHLDINEVAGKLKEIREYSDLPLGVGFGIKDGDTASAMASVADAVVVGSAIVSRVAELENDPERIKDDVGHFVSGLREAIDRTDSEKNKEGG